MSLKSSILKRQFDVTQDMALPRDLGDGLVLRYATLSDAEPLAQFNGWTHGRNSFDQQAAAWTRDLCSESHPACGPGNTSRSNADAIGSHSPIRRAARTAATRNASSAPAGAGIVGQSTKHLRAAGSRKVSRTRLWPGA